MNFYAGGSTFLEEAMWVKHIHTGAKNFIKLHFKYEVALQISAKSFFSFPNLEAFTTSEILGPRKIGMRINKNFGPIVK